MKKAVKIAIGVSVAGLSGLGIFAILRQKKLAKQAFAEFGGDDEDEIIVKNDVESSASENDPLNNDVDAELSDDEQDSDDDKTEAVKEEQEADNTGDDEMSDVDAELSDDEQDSDDNEDDNETEITDIYPPIYMCPYKSREVWASHIDELIGLLYKEIMNTTQKIDWAEIEKELIDKYQGLTENEFGVTGYEEKYIHHKVMPLYREQYKDIIDIIDSEIDSVFDGDINHKYMVDATHLNDLDIMSDIMNKCYKQGVTEELNWPSVYKYVLKNVDCTCKHIEACLAKEQTQ